MKKLMVALATVAMVAAVHAGAVTWKINYVVDPTSGADFTGGVAYLFNAADYASSVIIAALDDGSFSTSTYAPAYTDSLADGSISDAGILNGVYSGSTTLYSVILDKAYDYDGGGNYIVTSPVTQTIGASGTKIFKYDMNGATTDWTSYGGSSVPEPTSGMLMLLGVAGLALRRRRA